MLSNNDILKKLRVALELKDDDNPEAEELINKIVPPILVFPPLNVADCVTATGT